MALIHSNFRCISSEQSIHTYGMWYLHTIYTTTVTRYTELRTLAISNVYSRTYIFAITSCRTVDALYSNTPPCWLQCLHVYSTTFVVLYLFYTNPTVFSATLGTYCILRPHTVSWYARYLYLNNCLQLFYCLVVLNFYTVPLKQIHSIKPYATHTTSFQTNLSY